MSESPLIRYAELHCSSNFSFLRVGGQEIRHGGQQNRQRAPAASAFGEAACLFLRGNPAGQAYHQRLVNQCGKSKALSITAQKLGRAVYVMLKRKETFDMKKFLAG
jgi:hypothetical protein